MGRLPACGPSACRIPARRRSPLMWIDCQSRLWYALRRERSCKSRCFNSSGSCTATFRPRRCGVIAPHPLALLSKCGGARLWMWNGLTDFQLLTFCRLTIPSTALNQERHRLARSCISMGLKYCRRTTAIPRRGSRQMGKRVLTTIPNPTITLTTRPRRLFGTTTTRLGLPGSISMPDSKVFTSFATMRREV